MEALMRLRANLAKPEEDAKTAVVACVTNAVKLFLERHTAEGSTHVSRQDDRALEVCRALEDVLLHCLKPAGSLLDKLKAGYNERVSQDHSRMEKTRSLAPLSS
eukprot:m.28797 g.28797  ORF g.28797 m.28797 type:complete len:104 (-) comp9112_c0_seq1:1487-1798(-)